MKRLNAGYTTLSRYISFSSCASETKTNTVWMTAAATIYLPKSLKASWWNVTNRYSGNGWKRCLQNNWC